MRTMPVLLLVVAALALGANLAARLGDVGEHPALGVARAAWQDLRDGRLDQEAHFTTDFRARYRPLPPADVLQLPAFQRFERAVVLIEAPERVVVALTYWAAPQDGQSTRYGVLVELLREEGLWRLHALHAAFR